MQIAPIGFDNWLAAGNARTIRNALATEAEHALLIDKYSMWLATWKRQEPSIIGKAYYSGTTWRMRSRVPAFTPHMTAAFLIDGAGSIAVTIDGNAETITANVSGGTAGTHDVSTAQWVFPPALHALTHQDSPQEVEWQWVITDADASHTLRVFAVRPILLRPSASEALP